MTGPRLRREAEQRQDALAAADEKLVAVRDLFASALLAHARGRPDAAQRTRECLDTLQAARDVLRRLDAEERR